jgi:hypothetical protein
VRVWYNGPGDHAENNVFLELGEESRIDDLPSSLPVEQGISHKIKEQDRDEAVVESLIDATVELRMRVLVIQKRFSIKKLSFLFRCERREVFNKYTNSFFVCSI